jgi:hypothetical protein
MIATPVLLPHLPFWRPTLGGREGRPFRQVQPPLFIPRQGVLQALSLQQIHCFNHVIWTGGYSLGCPSQCRVPLSCNLIGLSLLTTVRLLTIRQGFHSSMFVGERSRCLWMNSIPAQQWTGRHWVLQFSSRCKADDYDFVAATEPPGNGVPGWVGAAVWIANRVIRDGLPDAIDPHLVVVARRAPIRLRQDVTVRDMAAPVTADGVLMIEPGLQPRVGIRRRCCKAWYSDEQERSDKPDHRTSACHILQCSSPRIVSDVPDNATCDVYPNPLGGQ